MLGFPIRKSSDPRSVDSSPRHIAASHVLRRLSMPRHSPCALRHLLTHKNQRKKLHKTNTPPLQRHGSSRPTPPQRGRVFVVLLRKEVIQPHLPVRLPCYDFVPIAGSALDTSLPQMWVRPVASGISNFHDVTGGVYKARERIHRSVADLRLLATPTSRGRVADPDPN